MRSPLPYIRKSKSVSPSPSRAAPTKPNASTAARTFRRVGKIGMRLPRPSPPLGNSSIPRRSPAISQRSRALRPKSKPLCITSEKARPLGRAFIFVDDELVDASARAVAPYWEIGGAGDPDDGGAGGGEEAVTAGGS